MRGATQCARRLKKLFSSLQSKLGKVGAPAGGEPVTQMILGILSRDVPESKAREALDRLRGMVVDYNELRVIPPIELAEMLGDYPDVRLKSEDISRSLNKVFMRNHIVNLDELKDLSRKEARVILEQIDGLEAYTRARVQLLGLHQHAIPLDEVMWAFARRSAFVDRRCPLEEAQAFLERQIPEEDALEFTALLKRQAWTEMGAKARGREVEQILSVPPDRTARNMLQIFGAAAEKAEPDIDEPPTPPPPKSVAAHPRKKTTSPSQKSSNGKATKRKTSKTTKKAAAQRTPRATKKITTQSKQTAAKKKPAGKVKRPRAAKAKQTTRKGAHQTTRKTRMTVKSA